MVFLRSFPAPTSTLRGADKVDETNVMDGMSGTRPLKRYMNNPNVMVGGDRLQIFNDQAVLVPVINAYWIATEPYADLGYMRGYTGPAIDHGDDPPGKDQITIDDNAIDLKDKDHNEIEMRKLRIVTSVFTAVIPESEYGMSLKDFLEVPLPSGNYPAIVEGYFILLKDFKFEPKPEGSFIIHSKARGPRDSHGPYFAELMYEIEVFDKDKVRKGEPTFPPARNDAIIRTILKEKHKKEELKQPELFRKIIGNHDNKYSRKSTRKKN